MKIPTHELKDVRSARIRLLLHLVWSFPFYVLAWYFLHLEGIVLWTIITAAFFHAAAGYVFDLWKLRNPGLPRSRERKWRITASLILILGITAILVIAK